MEPFVVGTEVPNSPNHDAGTKVLTTNLSPDRTTPEFVLDTEVPNSPNHDAGTKVLTTNNSVQFVVSASALLGCL